MRLIGLLGAVLGAAFIGGCVDHDTASIVVYGHASPVGPCGQRQIGAATATLTAGTYNVTYATDGYQFFPLVENRVVSRATQLDVNPNDVRLMEAEITLLTSAGDLLPTSGPNPFTTIASGFLRSGGFDAPQVTAIPIAYVPDLQAFVGDGTDTIIVRTQLFGETLGGVDVVAQPLDYPIDLVSGFEGFQCVGEIDGAELSGSEACYVGQDFVTDACDVPGLIDELCGGFAVCFPVDEM